MRLVLSVVSNFASELSAVIVSTPPLGGVGRRRPGRGARAGLGRGSVALLRKCCGLHTLPLPRFGVQVVFLRLNHKIKLKISAPT